MICLSSEVLTVCVDIMSKILNQCWGYLCLIYQFTVYYLTIFLFTRITFPCKYLLYILMFKCFYRQYFQNIHNSKTQDVLFCTHSCFCCFFLLPTLFNNLNMLAFFQTWCQVELSWDIFSHLRICSSSKPRRGNTTLLCCVSSVQFLYNSTRHQSRQLCVPKLWWNQKWERSDNRSHICLLSCV